MAKCIVALLILVSACYQHTPAQDTNAQKKAPWPTKQWARSVPAQQGLDGDRLDKLVAQIRDDSIRNVHSLLIVRNGYLVVEEYFGSHKPDQLHTLQSVSKSITSALVGIAIEKGRFKGVQEKVLDFFPDMKGIDRENPLRQKMTVKDLLTMRSGTDYHESGANSPHDQLNRRSTGWTQFILNRPMVKTPGEHYQYDSGAVILTSALIKQRYGVHADEFAKENLFKPLGITRYDWYRNSDNHPHTGGGLDLSSRDMAKFGLLYLRDGLWDGKQVVPKAWVRESLSRQVVFDPPKGRSVGYGYWWWVSPPDPKGNGKQDIYAALGFMGQHIFIVPEHDMVVVVTAGTHGEETRAIADFFFDDILGSVKR